MVMVPSLAQGSRLEFAQTLWGPLYEARLNLAGTTATIAPFGDPLHGQPDASTFTSVGDEQVVWTWQAGSPDGWDTPLDLRQDSSWQGIIPILKFNGTDEYITTPDAVFWNDTAASSEPSYTWIVWAKLIAGSGIQVLFTKSSVIGNSGQDWMIHIDGSEQFTCFIIDDSVGARIGRRNNSSIAGVWHQFAGTKSTGTTAAAINLYLDGADIDTNNSNAGSYVNQEDGTGIIAIGSENDGGSMWTGSMAGGPLGPLFVPAAGTVLTPDVIRRDYELGRKALGLI